MNRQTLQPTKILLDAKQYEQIKKSEISAYLKPQQIEMILNQCDAFTFNKGSCIVMQGRPTQGVYIIIKGSVELVARILGESNTQIDSLQSGGIIGGISFIDNGLSPASAIAKTKTTVLFISIAYFDFLNVIDPDARYRIMKAINTQLFKSMKRTHDKALHYISRSDMVSLSFLGRALHAICEPTVCEITSSTRQYLKEITNNPLLRHLTPEEKSELFAHLEVIKAPKNCVLIHEGDKSSSCYLILHGAVQSSIMSHNKLAKLSVIGPNSLFAGVACIDNTSAFTISFITCESAVLFKLSNKQLIYFKQNNPKLWYKLFDLISRSLVALGKSINKLDIRLHIETYNR